MGNNFNLITFLDRNIEILKPSRRVKTVEYMLDDALLVRLMNWRNISGWTSMEKLESLFKF